MKTKRINYAYPTSNIACEMGFPQTSCWYLALCNPDTAAEDNADKDEIYYCSEEMPDCVMYADSNEGFAKLEWHHYSHYKGA